MAAPSLDSTYPANNDTGIPIGIQLEFVFDRGIDEETARNFIVMYGADFDKTSGPDQAQWIHPDTGDNPFFLMSPGFTGLAELDFTLEYVDNTGGATSGTQEYADEAAEVTADVGHKVIATPKKPLAPDTVYTVYVIGDPDAAGTGISSRTTFSTVPDGGNSASTGTCKVWGTWEGAGTDSVEIEITTPGDIGTAKYRWWFTSEGVGAARTGKITNRKYRLLEDGLQVQFTGTGFLAGDIYRVNLEAAERLATSTTVSFTTNDGSFTTAPTSPSTPATSSPPSSILPQNSTSTTVGGDTFGIVDSTPDDRDYNVSVNTNSIVVTFSHDLDAGTITDDAITITKLPATGQYSDTFAPVELSKKLVVSGNQLTIEI